MVSDEFSIRPLDVGFDLRVQGVTIVTRAADSVRVLYIDRNGTPAVAVGAPAAVAATLREAGYKIELKG